MTIGKLLAELRNRDAVLYLDSAGMLRYAGPRLAADDPVRLAIAEHRAMLLELFVYTPGGRCAAEGCYRLRAEGSGACAGPHLVLDVLPGPSDAHQARRAAA